MLKMTTPGTGTPCVCGLALLMVLCLHLSADAEILGYHQGLDATYPSNGGYASSITSANGFMAIMSPNQHTTRVVAINHKSDVAGTFRVAVYKGGSYDNYNGAVKVYDSGQLYHNGGGWQEFPVDPPVIIERITWFGIAWKTDGASYYSVPKSEIPYSDCSFYYNLSGEGANSSLPFNDTLAVSTPALTSCKLHYVVDAPEPYITEVCNNPWAVSHPRHTNTPLNDGQQAVIYSGGTNSFMTPTVWITQNNDWANPGIKVQQTITSHITSLYFSTVFGGLTPGTDAYLWVENSTGVVNPVGVPVHLELPDSTPPELYGDLQIFPENAAKTLMGKNYYFTQQFYDPETTVFSCSGHDGSGYGTDSLPSGAGPYYTCRSVARTAAHGQVIKLQMTGESGGGMSVNWDSGYIDPDYYVYRTVDGMGPDSGTSFSASASSSTECSLSWTAASDPGAGLHETLPYEIRWQEGSDPGAGGTQVYAGTGLGTVHSGINSGSTHYYRLYYRDAFDNISEYSGNPAACTPPAVVVSDGSSPANKTLNSSAANVAISAFTLATTEGSATVTGLTVTGTATNHVGSVKLYRDSGSTVGEYDASDTLVAAGTFSGDQAALSGLSIAATTTPVQYLIVYDLAVQPAAGDSLNAYLSAGTALGLPVVVRDDADAVVMVDTIAPVTTDNVSSAPSAAEVTVTLTPGDVGGSGVSPAGGMFGCFGTGCTPAQLGGTTMTTGCGAGNTCLYDVSYYSKDVAGNTESVKKAVNQVLVDRQVPSGGSFTVYGNISPIILRWTDITDSGSGISMYQLRRTDGATPPAGCSSGTLIYQGTGDSFNDTGTNGQTYSYRLCVSDAVGNVASNYVGTGTVEQCISSVTCNSCHGTGGPPPTTGGSRIFPAAGHAYHGAQCSKCHREGGGVGPAHVDGNITISAGTGWNMSQDIRWPEGPVGGTCGGPWNPVGGPGNPMGCHSNGTPSYPGLTPQWECAWGNGRICTPPP